MGESRGTPTQVRGEGRACVPHPVTCPIPIPQKCWLCPPQARERTSETGRRGPGRLGRGRKALAGHLRSRRHPLPCRGPQEPPRPSLCLQTRPAAAATGLWPSCNHQRRLAPSFQEMPPLNRRARTHSTRACRRRALRPQQHARMVGKAAMSEAGAQLHHHPQRGDTGQGATPP